jgi:hypothetical protein
MGHSTGCQDVMEYLTGAECETRPPIDGGIIQAPASDREGMLMSMPESIYKSSCEAAQKMVDAGDGTEILPTKKTKGLFPGVVTAKRFLSLASPNHDGDDDYFSSDLSDEQLMKSFGRLPKGTPLCVLHSGNDEYVPESISKQGLLDRWTEITNNGEGRIDEVASGVIEGASHSLGGNAEGVVGELVQRVLKFLDGLEVQPNL